MNAEENRGTCPTANGREQEPSERILVMTAVEAEREAVLQGLQDTKGFDVILAGVGPAMVAARTAKALSSGNYKLVISAGIGGGFPGKAGIGDIVIAGEIIAADLGAETQEGFSILEELGFGSSCIQTNDMLVSRIAETFNGAGLPVHIGPVLTVSTATGTSDSALALAARIEGAAAEAMEGYGVAAAAQDQGVPVLEIRSVSNMVGPRDKSAWRIKEALAALSSASSVLREVLR
ncbi:futalosine hydrolase [Paenibacillus larvae]|nr:futalosine hydrolase [Paenibacillus larvae]MDT2305282.1 futalosine hydrolase [Paenibacillus larvae]